MTLEHALSLIHAPQGVTSLIAGICGGDLSVLRNPQVDVSGGRAAAEVELKKAEDRLAATRSDYAYWSELGTVAYWRAVVDLFRAAEIAGADALPDVPPPKQGAVVMDAIAYVQQFGKSVLNAAMRAAHTPEEPRG